MATPTTPSRPTQQNQLQVNEGLTVGDALYTFDYQYNLALQSDGNLVLYGPEAPLWSANTYGMDAFDAVLQADGNFAVLATNGNLLWASGTTAKPYIGSLLILKDGGFVIYTAENQSIFSAGLLNISSTLTSTLISPTTVLTTATSTVTSMVKTSQIMF